MLGNCLSVQIYGIHFTWSLFRLSRYNSSSDNVNISHPSVVTKTVCSNCADRLPSSVTAVHPSSSKIFTMSVPSDRMGSGKKYTVAFIAFEIIQDNKITFTKYCFNCRVKGTAKIMFFCIWGHIIYLIMNFALDSLSKQNKCNPLPIVNVIPSFIVTCWDSYSVKANNRN